MTKRWAPLLHDSAPLLMLAPLCVDWTLLWTDSMVLIRNHWPAFLCALGLPLVCFTAGKASAQPVTLSGTIESHHPCAYYGVSSVLALIHADSSYSAAA